MKNISQVFECMSEEQLKALYIERPSIDSGTGRVINYLFKRIQGFIPAFKYSADSQLTLDLIKREWCYGIQDSGINTIEQLNSGLNKLRLRGDKFLPTVGNFVNLCKLTPEEKGYPSVEKAYDEACRNYHPSANKQWSHIAIRHAASGMSWDLSNERRSVSYPKFEKRYLESLALHSDGMIKEQLPSPKQASKPKSSSREAAMEAIKNLKRMLA